MAGTDPYGRAIKPEEEQEKLPIHVLFSATTLLVRGTISPAAYHALCGTNAEDLQPGGQIHSLTQIVESSGTPEAQYASGKDIWNLACLAEWDVQKDNVLNLHSLSNFEALAQAIADYHAGLWK